MKSIEATLKLVSSIVAELRKHCRVDIALAGGYAVIAHGVGRTTTDTDFYIYSQQVQKDFNAFYDLLKRAIPSNFEVRLMQGSKIPDDPFPYDIVFLNDRSAEYPRIDFIFPKYKWELEGIINAKVLADIPFPVMPKPYLIAMKLKAGGPKDHFDILELYEFLSDDEKKKTTELAVLIRRDKNLTRLLKDKRIKPEESEDENLLI